MHTCSSAGSRHALSVTSPPEILHEVSYLLELILYISGMNRSRSDRAIRHITGRRALCFTWLILLVCYLYMYCTTYNYQQTEIIVGERQWTELSNGAILWYSHIHLPCCSSAA